MTDELRGHGDECALHLEREYVATADEVWDAWTDPERLARWLARASSALLSAAAGEPVRLTFGAGADDWAELTVLTAEAPRVLELQWCLVDDVASVVRIEIGPIGENRVRVVLDHRGLGRSTIGYGAGWEAYLSGLAGEFGLPSAATWDELFEAALPAWQRRAAAG